MTMGDPTNQITDTEREQMISSAGVALQAAKTATARRAAWDRLKDLIKGRSPQQVQRMERSNGLVV